MLCCVVHGYSGVSVRVGNTLLRPASALTITWHVAVPGPVGHSSCGPWQLRPQSGMFAMTLPCYHEGQGREYIGF